MVILIVVSVLLGFLALMGYMLYLTPDPRDRL
jgi:hypothetical protein